MVNTVDSSDIIAGIVHNTTVEVTQHDDVDEEVFVDAVDKPVPPTPSPTSKKNLKKNLDSLKAKNFDSLIENIKYTDFDEHLGIATGVYDQPFQKYTVMQLRKMTKKLNPDITIKHKNKKQMIDVLIWEHQKRTKVYNNNTDSDSADNDKDKPSDKPKTTRRKQQCPFRLMNLIFSDEFAEDFSRLGDPAT